MWLTVKLLKWAGAGRSLSALAAWSVLFAAPLTASAQAPGAGDELAVRVVAELSASTAYVGQRVTLTYRILSRNYVSEIEVRDQPQYAGFWVKELSGPARGRHAGQMVDGLYDVAAKRILLYPAIPGHLHLMPITLAIRAYPDLEAGGATAGPSNVMRSSQPLALEVRPLPPPPAGGPPFTGAVGQFALEASLQPSYVRLGETAEVEIKVRGNGNADALIAPTLPESSGLKFHVKRVASTGEAAESPDGLSEARWRATVAAGRVGTYEIPIAFTYFDPRVGQYRTARSTPLSLKVGEAEQTPRLEDGIDAPHQPELALESPAIASAKSLVKWVGYGAVGVGILMALLITIRRRGRRHFAGRVAQESQDGSVTSPEAAAEVRLRERVEDCLEMAERAAHTGDGRRFYAGLSQALGATFEVRFGMSQAELTTESIAERLGRHGIDAETAREAAESFSRLDALRFRPQADFMTDKQELDRVRRLIETVR